MREPDGWIGSDGGYVYFGPAKRGMLMVEVSRAGLLQRTGHADAT